MHRPTLLLRISEDICRIAVITILHAASPRTSPTLSTRSECARHVQNTSVTRIYCTTSITYLKTCTGRPCSSEFPKTSAELLSSLFCMPLLLAPGFQQQTLLTRRTVLAAGPCGLANAEMVMAALCGDAKSKIPQGAVWL